MKSRADLLADAVADSRLLLERFLAGFDDSNRTRQAPGLSNHAAWQLGHLALHLHRAAERIDGRTLPETDFLTGDGRGGDAARFDTESICFGSRPIDDAALYPTWARCVEIFRGASARLEQVVRAADDATLERTEPWGRSGGRSETTTAGMVMRMIFHNGTHAGQLVDLRRGLGMKGVIE